MSRKHAAGRQGHATVVAYVALFVALSGSAWAVATIGPGDIKKNAIRSKHVKADTLTGADVNEATLGTVPAAQSAGTAANANTLDGMDSADFLGVNATAANAQQLDGLDSGAFALANHNHDSAYVNEGQADSVSAAMIQNTAGTVSVPLGSFYDCDGAGVQTPPDDSGGAEPGLVSLVPDGGPVVMRFDDTGGAEDQNFEICSNFVVPADFDLGGGLVIRADPDGASAPGERIECGVSVNGAALVTSNSSDLFDANNSYSCTPSVTYSATAGVQFYIRIDANAAMNDTVDVYSVWFSYNAKQ